MITVGIYIKDAITLQYNRVELFDDEKISVNSSIQNVNDISKLTTDFSQTFTVPATKQNNKIFKHWYENSLDNSFDTLVKTDAYIELDTIPFRRGKIQLESCSVIDGQPQNYSITFLGALANLKDIFAGLFLKDLTATDNDIEYTGTIVKQLVTQFNTSSNVMFPLITSVRNWNYGSSIDPTNDINNNLYPIKHTELFPALRLSNILLLIGNQFGINFNGTTADPSTFISDNRFKSAYLWLKNAETFTLIKNNYKVNFSNPMTTNQTGIEIDFATDIVDVTSIPDTITIGFDDYYFQNRLATVSIFPTASGIEVSLAIFKNGEFLIETGASLTSAGISKNFPILSFGVDATTDYYEYYVRSSQVLTFTSNFDAEAIYENAGTYYSEYYNAIGLSQTTSTYYLPLRQYMPEIKIEDFFSGLLKQFNLVCYSLDGINYTIKELENFYDTGNVIDITKYIQSDKVDLTRVKTYKKINFEYQKSDSYINVAFNSANGVEYGSLLYTTNNDGSEYSIKLPFETLNFENLKSLLQVGYSLKTDLQKYIPKPVILYDYNPTSITNLVDTTFQFNNGISTTAHTTYKPFGQEYFNGTDTFSLNFNEQQSTLTNELIGNSLYQEYYQNYLLNIFDSKARLIKVSGILPTSLLTSLKLNDRLIIRDKRYLINNIVTDLTTGEVQFELLTDFRAL